MTHSEQPESPEEAKQLNALLDSAYPKQQHDYSQLMDRIMAETASTPILVWFVRQRVVPCMLAISIALAGFFVGLRNEAVLQQATPLSADSFIIGANY